MKIKPIGRKILVKKLEKRKTREEIEKAQEETVSKGGIILLGDDKAGDTEQYFISEILEFGGNVDKEQVNLSEGDNVYIMRYVGNLMEDDMTEDPEHDYYLVDPEDIVAIISK